MTASPFFQKTVLVTGGTGFIGGRLVELLHLEHGAQVRVLVKRFGRAMARIGRLPVQLIPGDVSSPADVRAAMHGCDYVFHCAYANEGGEKAQHRVNVGGVQAVLQAARDLQPQRVVHVSTMAVYGQNPAPELTENAPYGVTGDPYGRTKRQAEVWARTYSARHNLPLSIIQPAIVYGPYGGAWTYGPLRRLRTHNLYLPRYGQGICNLVYVDDVVNAMLLCATHPAALGERFLVSGAAITWAEFYGYFEAMLQRQAIIWQRPPQTKHQWAWLGRGRAIWQALSTIWHESPNRREHWTNILKLTGLQTIQQILPENAWERLKTWAVSLSDINTMIPANQSQSKVIVPSGYEYYLYDKQGVISTKKITQTLGYSTCISPVEGMKRTYQWANWANLLNYA